MLLCCHHALYRRLDEYAMNDISTLPCDFSAVSNEYIRVWEIFAVKSINDIVQCVLKLLVTVVTLITFVTVATTIITVIGTMRHRMIWLHP